MLDILFQSIEELKKKLSASRAMYISHIEAVQNVVRLHKASSIAGLEEISLMASSSTQSIKDVGFNYLGWLFYHFVFL
jgi:kinesin family protein 11